MNDATSDVLAAVEQIIQVPDTSTDNVQVPDTKSEEPTETAEAAPEPTPEVESEDQTEVEAEADEPSDSLELDDDFDDIDLAEDVSESDTLIPVKINGKEERWTLDQLKQSAAGQGYINQRMQEVAKLEKDYKAQTQALAQQQAQMAQNQPDPNAAYLQAEAMKAQGKMQSDMMKLQLDAQKAAAEDDLKRDQMAQDLLVDAAKVAGEYGTAVDVARVKAEQDKIRTIAGIAQGQ